MTHDDHEKEALFLQYWPSLLSMSVFVVMIMLGTVKWVYKMHIFHWKKQLRGVLRHTLTAVHESPLKALPPYLIRGRLRRVSRWLLQTFFGHEKRLFIYEFEKSADCCAGAGLLDCMHDETISNKANTRWKKEEFKTPKWVIIVKLATEHVRPGHLEESEEALRTPPAEVLQPRRAKPTKRKK